MSKRRSKLARKPRRAAEKLLGTIQALENPTAASSVAAAARDICVPGMISQNHTNIATHMQLPRGQSGTSLVVVVVGERPLESKREGQVHRRVDVQSLVHGGRKVSLPDIPAQLLAGLFLVVSGRSGTAEIHVCRGEEEGDSACVCIGVSCDIDLSSFKQAFKHWCSKAICFRQLPSLSDTPT